MPGYKYTGSSLEKDRMMDILLTQKHLTDLYNNSTNETDNSSLHTEVLNILNEEHELAFKLYSEMKKRGWYDVKMADSSDMNKLYSESSKTKNEMKI